MIGDWDSHHLLGVPDGASPAAAVEVHGWLVTAAETIGADRSHFGAAPRAVLDQRSQDRAAFGNATCGGGATEADPVAPELELGSKSAGWPITFGAPASDLAASGFAASAVRAGTAGEVEAAAWIDASVLAADAFVCHSVTPSGGSGDVDHVVIRGDLLICVDAKRWAPGRYESVQTATGMVAYRNGQPFPAGSVSSIGFLSERLCADLGRRGRVERIIAVSSSGGPGRPVSLDGYRHPEATAVAVDQLPALLDRLLATAVPWKSFAIALRTLAARTNSPLVRSPLMGPAAPGSAFIDTDIARGREPAAPELSGLPAEAVTWTWRYGIALALALVLGTVLPHMPRVLAAGLGLAAGALAWRLWIAFADLETAAARSGGELTVLRSALLLDPSIALRSMEIPPPRSVRAAVAGLCASYGGVFGLVLLRRGSALDFSHLAILAIVGGALVLAVATFVLLDSDVSFITQRLRDRPELWAEAVEALLGANGPAAAEAMAVAAEYPDGVLVDYFEEFVDEDDPAAVALGLVGLTVASSAVVRS